MPSSACKTCARSEEHTSELQSHDNLVCRLLLEKNKHNEDDPAEHMSEARDSCFSAVAARLTLHSVPTTDSRRSSAVRPLRQSCFFFFKDAGPPGLLPPSPTRPFSD